MHVGEFVEGEHGTEAERKREKSFFLFLFSVSSPSSLPQRCFACESTNCSTLGKTTFAAELNSSDVFPSLSLRLLSPPPAAVRILLVRRNERDRGRRAQLQLLGTSTETSMMVGNLLWYLFKWIIQGRYAFFNLAR